MALDTASDIAGVALLEDGSLLGETTWHARMSHSRQLLPAVDWLLGHVGRDKRQVTGIAVSLGPGSYAGMRVGLSTAKALAFGLEVPLTGIGRLAADALPVAEASRARVVPVQAAGRAELAFAAYEMEGASLAERAEPQLIEASRLTAVLLEGDIVTGEVDRLTPDVVANVEAMGCRLVASIAPRAVSVARLGLDRLGRGEFDNPDSLVPLYLRAPAIGPQTQR
jgi:tRNA threonylcarbamoyl adenosine modification protein YeaZ